MSDDGKSKDFDCFMRRTVSVVGGGGVGACVYEFFAEMESISGGCRMNTILCSDVLCFSYCQLCFHPTGDP